MFVDPALNRGLAPFNIVSIGRNLYVTYRGPGRRTPRTTCRGVGNGRIDVFDIDGNFVEHAARRAAMLNAPWGIALAPDAFGSSLGGSLSGQLIVGNFGDGTMLVMDPTSGANSAVDGLGQSGRRRWPLGPLVRRRQERRRVELAVLRRGSAGRDSRSLRADHAAVEPADVISKM